MKKAVWLIIAIAAIASLIFYLKTWSPFFGITGKSMEPTFNTGDLIFIKSISALEVKEGDIIVFEVPSLVREHYNYPQIVAHRVIATHQRDGEIVFQTKGDNTGNDPFIVRPSDLEGAVSQKIPVLGFLFLFLQSEQGLISIAVIIFLIGISGYSLEIKQLRKKAQKEIFSPILEEQQEQTKALNHFASAMAEYAKHL
ncbi:MAG: signal peptidase I, partial [Candidatus Nealsonbacteria bacterium]|nr:signal peptidase I [Candidatus Nealsonbacteria bacterium]